MIKELEREITWMKFKLVARLDTSSKNINYIKILELALPKVREGQYIEGVSHVLGQLEQASAERLIIAADRLAATVPGPDTGRMVHRYMNVIRDIEDIISGGRLTDETVMELLLKHSSNIQLPPGGIGPSMARVALRITLRQKHDLYGKVIVKLLQRNSE